MIDVRKAPRPPFERAPLRDGRRVCPMCGEMTTAKRGWWHSECAEAWRYAGFPADAARLLRELHGLACWACGAIKLNLAAMVRQREWHDDAYEDAERRPPIRIHTVPPEYEHVRPLWSLSDAERRELKWWLPFNLQLLCRACHRVKTAREAADRYAIQNPDGTLAQKRRVAAMSPELWS